MQRIILITIACFFWSLALAQPHSTAIKQRGLDMARALLRSDFEGYVSYLHPKLRSNPADQQQMRQGIDSAEKYRKQLGIKISKVLIGNPVPVQTYKTVLQSALVQTTTIESLMGSIVTENVLVALSEDGGRTWYFAEGTLYEKLQKEKGLPPLSPDLQLPPVKPPVVKPAAVPK
ncbi:MAG TPA: hypothetical protein PKE63_01245 [Lacibacter sp.]|nr:hypothetical protein [Lacibacter sp.]HMO88829.1 hypothetical protein [Lacibacter sp.]HMP85867.1 hypothetical protein [Lacibacter sp.]